MAWQLWVLVAAAGFGVVRLLVVRFRHAQEVFDGLVSSVDHHVEEAEPPSHHPPEYRPEVAARPEDDLSRRRGRHHFRTRYVPHAVHGHRTRR